MASLLRPVVLLLLLLGVPAISFAQPTVGSPAPNFSLRDQSGQTHELSQYRGKIVVLEWTNPGCPFVRKHYEQGTMTRLAAANPEVVWLTIDSSHFFDAAAGARWAGEHGVRHLLGDASGTVGRSYSARVTPHLYVIDQQGVLAYQGAIDNNPYGNRPSGELQNYVAEAITALKAGRRPAQGETQPYGCSVKYQR